MKSMSKCIKGTKIQCPTSNEYLPIRSLGSECRPRATGEELRGASTNKEGAGSVFGGQLIPRNGVGSELLVVVPTQIWLGFIFVQILLPRPFKMIE
jgi:hypothetical protein